MSTTVIRRGRDLWQQVPATWGAYLHLLRARGERPSPRYTYINGRLTIVSPGASHGALSSRLAWLLEWVLVALDIPFQPFGSLTLKEGTPGQKGTEADDCYYLTNIDQVRGKKRIRMGVDPAPDLAIEVVVSHPVRDALKVHAAFGVREVWVCKEDGLQFLVLGEGGRYAPSPTSACLPFFASAELAPWVFRQDLPSETAVRRLFLNWVSDVLAPRYGPQAE